jgi:hypothetical protein
MTLRPVILAALAVTLTLTSPTPALAHHGYAGPVRLYLETVRLETHDQAGRLQVGVNDAGTGQPAPGFVVDAVASGPSGSTVGPIYLTDVDADGRYEAPLGSLPPGDWSVTVNVTDAPNSEERAVPVTRTWNVTLRPNESLELVGRQTTLDTKARPSSSGSSSTTLTAFVALAALAAALALALTRKRHRPPVPAP